MVDAILNSFETHATKSKLKKIFSNGSKCHYNHQSITSAVECSTSLRSEFSTETFDDNDEFEHNIKQSNRDENIFIKFSSNPIVAEPIVAEFDQNVISLRISEIFKNKSTFSQLNENEKALCKRCKAFTSFFTQIENNQWKCNFCKNFKFNLLKFVSSFYTARKVE